MIRYKQYCTFLLPPSSSDSSVCDENTLALLASVKDAADTVDFDVPVAIVSSPKTLFNVPRFLGPSSSKTGGGGGVGSS